MNERRSERSDRVQTSDRATSRNLEPTRFQTKHKIRCQVEKAAGVSLHLHSFPRIVTNLRTLHLDGKPFRFDRYSIDRFSVTLRHPSPDLSSVDISVFSLIELSFVDW